MYAKIANASTYFGLGLGKRISKTLTILLLAEMREVPETTPTSLLIHFCRFNFWTPKDLRENLFCDWQPLF